MPIYTFKNKKTGEEKDFEMSWQECEAFQEKQKRTWERVYKPVATGDSIRLGVTKPPSDFMKGVIGRIKNSVPGNTVERSYAIPKEV